MQSQNQIKQQIMTLLDTLPSERLEEVVDFVEFLRRKTAQQMSISYTPIALGGLWPDVSINDEDIAEARADMWHNFGEREP
jgi:hypothetical protein